MQAKPTFLGIGAQKCATTWLHDILADHPQVCLPPIKELDFFSFRFDFGFQWYERQFDRRDGQEAVGEVSPSYFHGACVPCRIYEYNRLMRLILFLRNPVERAWSNHKHEVRIGHLAGDDLSFEFGLANNPSYVEQGFYSRHLERWLEYFPMDQIFVVLLEEIASDPAGVARRVYRFLDINHAHHPRALTSRANASYIDRFPWLAAARINARAGLRRAGMDGIWEAVARAGGRRLYRRLNRANSESVIPPIQDATRSALRERFEPDIRQLETLLGRSLESWL